MQARNKQHKCFEIEDERNKQISATQGKTNNRNIETKSRKITTASNAKANTAQIY